MATINELLIKLEADTTQLRRAFDQAEKQVDQSGRRMQGALSKVDGSVGALAGSFKALLPVLSVGAISIFAKGALDAAGGLGELSEQIGLSTDALQAYEFAGAQAGIKTEELQRSFIRLRQAIGEAAQGEKTQVEAFRNLGIGVLDANGKLRDSEAIFKDLARAYVEAEDKAVFFANAQDLLGRNAQKLAPLLAGGAEGVDQMVASAKAAGVVLSADLIKAADDASDRIAALGVQMSKTGQIAVGRLAPAISTVVDGLRRIFFETDIEGADRLIAKFNAISKASTGYAEERKRILNELARLQPEQFDATGGAAGGGGAPIRPGGTAEGPNTNPLTKEQIKEAEARAKKIEDVVKALELERDNLSRTAEQQAIYNALAKAGVDLNTEAGARIAKLASETANLKQAKEALAEEAKRELAAVKEAEQAEIAYQKELNDRIGVQRRITEGLGDELSNNEKLIAALRISTEEYEKQAAVQEILGRYKAANIELTAEEIAKIEEQAKALGRQRDQLDTLKTRHDEVKRAGADATRVIATGFENVAISGGKASDALKALEQDLVRIIYRLTVTKPLENAFTDLLGSGGSSGGGIWGSIFSGVASYFGGSGVSAGNAGLASNLAMYGREDGGPVQAGVPYLVGERRPEIFVPETAGRIIPRVGGFGGGEQVVVHQSFNFTGDVTAQTRAEVLRLAPMLKEQAVAAMQNKVRRGVRA